MLVLLAISVKPSAYSTILSMVSPSSTSYVAGRLIAPVIFTKLLAGLIRIVSPASISNHLSVSFYKQII